MLTSNPFTDIPTALEDIRAGRMVVVVDDEDRENEGDLTIAAEMITPDIVNFMAKFGRGLICLAMTGERIDHLGLRPMAPLNTSRFGTAFTESIDAARRGVTTGVSARDRAETIRCAIDAATHAQDLARPGHVFPLRAQAEGVLARPGQTEASVDLARLAGLRPAGVICEIMNDDGTMARVPDLVRFCDQHKMRMITVADLIRYRMEHDFAVFPRGAIREHTSVGEFCRVSYASELVKDAHEVWIFGDLHCEPRVPHVRLQSAEDPLEPALEAIAEAGSGLIIASHARLEGAPGIGGGRTGRMLTFDTGIAQIDALFAARILCDLGVKRICLLSDGRDRIAELAMGGVEVVDWTFFRLRSARSMSRREDRLSMGAD